MTFDSLEEIKERIDNPVNSNMLHRAELALEKHRLHVGGIGLDDYIDKIQGVENENALSLRRALGKVITKPEFQKIITVEQKVFSAHGGATIFDFTNESQEQFFKQEILKDVKEGLSSKEFMSNIWANLVNIDACGLLLGEIDENEKLQLTYKASSTIHDIEFKGAYKIEYVIFKPVITKQGLLYRVIDDRTDYTILVKGKTISVVEEFKNYFGYVPGVFISDRNDKAEKGFVTHIEEAMIPADDMLLDYTIHKIYKTKIGVPLHWQYERECATCEGSGHVLDKESGSEMSCAKCDGTGLSNYNRDIADIIVLPTPEADDVPMNPPAGYVQPDLASWTKQEETIERLARKMYEVVWGESSVIESDRRNITAAELTVRDGSKENKLNRIADNAEKVLTFIINLFGDHHFGESYKGVLVRYGRHYVTKTSAQLFEEYQNAITSNVPTSQLNDILENYFYSMYENNKYKLNESIIKLKSKPFYHWMPDRIQNANVNEVDYYKNIYFEEFCTWYEQNVSSIGTSTIEDFQNKLNEWITQKIPEQEGIGDLDAGDSAGFSQEQMESQASLRGSVGGVQGILETQKSVQLGTTDYDAALELLKEIYGFDDEKAKSILGKRNNNNNINIEENERQE